MKIGTFCTGIGSPEFALEDVPHELIFGCEIDKFARASYLSRYKPKFMLEDMTKVDFSNPELYTDLVMAGLPCQAFSIAGKRLGELDKRGVLIYNFYDYVKQQQPKAFILENVKGLKSINKGEIFKNWQRILGRSVNGKPIEDMHPDSLCYNLHWQVLNTKNFDLPQNRERIFIIGIRADLYDDYKFPENRELKVRLKDILEENVPEKYYLSDKIINTFLRRNEEAKFCGKFRPKNTNEIGILANCITQSYYMFGPTDNYLKINQSKNLTPNQPKRNLPGGNEMRSRVYSDNGISPTITAKQGGGHEPVIQEHFIGGGLQANQHPRYDGISPSLTSAMGMGGGQIPVHTYDYRIRRLTPLECWRLQGYSDEYFYQAKEEAVINTALLLVNSKKSFNLKKAVKGMSDTQLYKQAGNSISTTVAKAVILPVLTIINTDVI